MTAVSFVKKTSSLARDSTKLAYNSGAESDGDKYVTTFPVLVLTVVAVPVLVPAPVAVLIPVFILGLVV